ncbi:MAG: hypothetical protein ABIN57_12570 [Chitinophagaceae bacterium]
MRQKAFLLFIGWCSLLLVCKPASAQTKSDSSFKPNGNLWGYSFGDFYYKAHTDALNRGGANQYTGIEKGRNAFQFRRIYLGYNYNIHPKFSAELLLAAEDNIATKSGLVSGDLTSNGKFTFFIKYAYIRWKNIWKGTDLVVGQSATPAFSLVEEPIWGYRSIERTISDIRRMPSYDLGVSLQGKFDPEVGNYGYNLMVANGSGAKPEANKFKHFYGDVFAKFLDKKIVLSLFADYERIKWQQNFHHSRNMVKGFAAYTTPAFTIGVEAFAGRGLQDVVGVRKGTGGILKDTLTLYSKGISTFVRGTLVKDKLAYFARVDNYQPNKKYNENRYDNYDGLTSTYEPNNNERFATAGLDFTPIKNVHFMPNVWYNQYKSARSDASGSAKKDHDLVYRVTFYYVYGR